LRGDEALLLQRLENIVENMEPLWLTAEASVAAVEATERRLTGERPASVAEFRERVLQAMVFAHREEFEDYGERLTGSREELEGVLDALIQERGLRFQLASLEEFVMELEGCRNELAKMEKQAEALRDKRDGFASLQSQAESLLERQQRIVSDIRTICQTVQDSADMQAAFKSVGDALAGLNPFR